MRTIIGAVLFWMTLSAPTFAQQLVVQQPVVGTTSVATSVMVPNGGRTFLGGVASAQSGRSRFGFSQPGSSLGLSRSSNSMSVGVTVIDLREMDEAILNSVPDRPVSSSSFARHAAAIRSAGEETRREPPQEAESLADRAVKFERLALKAEADKRLGVAKLHWKMAAKYGSSMARERLVASSR
jgi:hypothetical protein